MSRARQARPASATARSASAGPRRNAAQAGAQHYQRAMGNLHISRMVPAQQGVQAKLKVGAADDRYEREADAHHARAVAAAIAG